MDFPAANGEAVHCAEFAENKGDFCNEKIVGKLP